MRGKAKQKTSSTPAPWWVSGGEEVCADCGQLYAYEMEFRCPDCDNPFCPHCKTLHPQGHYVCTSCVVTVSTETRGKGRSHGR